jgi:hypothetical protein
MSKGSNNVKRGTNLERRVAKFLGGRRFWVSSGERIDVESPHFLVQTKKVSKMALPELVRLAIEMEGWASTDRHDTAGKSWKDKVGMVAVQLTRPPEPGEGAVINSPVIYLMTQAQLKKLFDKMNFTPEVLNEMP